MKAMPSKWATGARMVEWCERNGFDADRIADRPDAAFEVTYPDIQALCDHDPSWRQRPLVRAWQVVTDHEEHYPRTGQEWRDNGHGHIEVLETRQADSEPPLNPEWVRLFRSDL